jgi:hypothetical protein
MVVFVAKNRIMGITITAAHLGIITVMADQVNGFAPLKSGFICVSFYYKSRGKYSASQFPNIPIKKFDSNHRKLTKTTIRFLSVITGYLTILAKWILQHKSIETCLFYVNPLFNHHTEKDKNILYLVP